MNSKDAKTISWGDASLPVLLGVSCACGCGYEGMIIREAGKKFQNPEWIEHIDHDHFFALIAYWKRECYEGAIEKESKALGNALAEQL